MQARGFGAQASAEGSSAIASTYPELFRNHTTRYDPAVHGAFNASTGAPFYDAASEDVLWDTSDGKVGDGEPDPWGAYAYDTVMMCASAALSAALSTAFPQSFRNLSSAFPQPFPSSHRPLLDLPGTRTRFQT